MPNSMESPGAAFRDTANYVSATANAAFEQAPRVTLRQLTYFVGAGDHESVTRAAEVLNVSPPAISGAISYLEQFLGAPLFLRRHARGLVLTEFGHRLLLEARIILNQARAIEALQQTGEQRAPQRLEIGCLGDIAPYVIPPVVRDFMRHNPGLEVRWQSADHATLMERLVTGAIDLALFLDFEQSPNFHTTILRPTPVQCVLPRWHPLAKEALVRLEDLLDEPFILLDIAKTSAYFLSIFGNLGLAPRIAHQVGSAERARSMVANGFGYSLLNFWAPGGRSEEESSPVYRPIDTDVRPSNLVAARLYKSRTPLLIEQFLRHAEAVVRDIPFAAALPEPGSLRTRTFAASEKRNLS